MPAKSCAPRINYLGNSSNVIFIATWCYLKGMALQETPFKSHSIWKFDNNMNSFWMIWRRLIWNSLLVLNLLPLNFLQQCNNSQPAAIGFSDYLVGWILWQPEMVPLGHMPYAVMSTETWEPKSGHVTACKWIQHKHINSKPVNSKYYIHQSK